MEDAVRRAAVPHWPHRARGRWSAHLRRGEPIKRGFPCETRSVSFFGKHVNLVHGMVEAAPPCECTQAPKPHRPWAPTLTVTTSARGCEISVVNGAGGAAWLRTSCPLNTLRFFRRYPDSTLLVRNGNPDQIMRAKFLSFAGTPHSREPVPMVTVNVSTSRT